MHGIRGVFALVGVLSVYTNCTLAQTTESDTEAGPAGVTLSVAPAVSSAQSPVSNKVKISVTNSTSSILVHTFPENRGSVQIEVSDPSGVVPPETVLGCELHMSKKCGPSVKLFGPTSFTAMIVMPGQTISFQRDLSSEFDLANTHSVVVRVIARDFVLVDAPQSVAEAPAEQRRGYLMDYQRYPYTKLAPFRSKAVTLQVGH